MIHLMPIALSALMIALAVWMYHFLPGWVGILLAGLLLFAAVSSTLMKLIGVGGRQRVKRLWRELFEFVSGF